MWKKGRGRTAPVRPRCISGCARVITILKRLWQQAAFGLFQYRARKRMAASYGVILTFVISVGQMRAQVYRPLEWPVKYQKFTCKSTVWIDILTPTDGSRLFVGLEPDSGLRDTAEITFASILPQARFVVEHDTRFYDLSNVLREMSPCMISACIGKVDGKRFFLNVRSASTNRVSLSINGSPLFSRAITHGAVIYNSNVILSKGFLSALEILALAYKPGDRLP